MRMGCTKNPRTYYLSQRFGQHVGIKILSSRNSCELLLDSNYMSLNIYTDIDTTTIADVG